MNNTEIGVPFTELAVLVQSMDGNETLHCEHQDNIERTQVNLKLSGRHIQRLLPALDKLTSLTSLHMCQNYLETLPSEIGRLKNLLELWLSFNQIKDLPASIGELTKLELLSLDGNCLTRLPNGMTRLSSLQHLVMDNNPFVEEIVFPKNWNSLTLLSIDSCNQYSISPTINHLTSVRILCIGQNYWQTLPNLKGLAQLKTIFINEMKVPLRRLPESMKSLAALEYLACMNSGLMELPEWLPNLISLEQLELGNNQLTELPSSIGNMESLYRLVLTGNQLTQIPKAVAKIRTLQHLVMPDNPILSFPIALYYYNRFLDLVCDAPDFSGCGNSSPTLEEYILKKDRLPQSLKIQAARKTAGQKKNLTRADLSENCLELLASAKECSTLSCKGIFVRGGGTEKNTAMELINVGGLGNHTVQGDTHTCDFQCTEMYPQNRT